jgi:hypothetical protein
VLSLSRLLNIIFGESSCFSDAIQCFSMPTTASGDPLLRFFDPKIGQKGEFSSL